MATKKESRATTQSRRDVKVADDKKAAAALEKIRHRDAELLKRLAK